MSDFSDHNIWRLLLTVGYTGIEALFFDSVRHTFVPYMRREWECAPADLLGRIEDAVYEDPVLLDDYRSYILIRPAATLLVPPHLVDPDDRDGNAKALDAVDAAVNKDVWCEPLGEAVALYSTPCGVKDFLSRSFLTEDVHHVLVPMVEHFTPKAKDEGGEKMWVHVGRNMLDAVVFRDGRLLHAGSWKYAEPADAAYFILFALRALGVDASRCEVRLSGEEAAFGELLPMLRQHISYVGLTVTSSVVGAALRAGVGMSQILTVL